MSEARTQGVPEPPFNLLAIKAEPPLLLSPCENGTSEASGVCPKGSENQLPVIPFAYLTPTNIEIDPLNCR